MNPELLFVAFLSNMAKIPVSKLEMSMLVVSNNCKVDREKLC